MDNKYKNRFRIDSARLPLWDYGSDGWYFITISTNKKVPYFGELKSDGGLVYSILGDFAAQCWQTIPHFHPFAKLDQFVLMPEHFHAILLFSKKEMKPWQINQFGPQTENLAAIIRGFKSVVTSFAKQHEIDFSWQARFHDRIIRNENELVSIRKYIEMNPKKHAESS